jgi:hypothetical protein
MEDRPDEPMLQGTEADTETEEEGEQEEEERDEEILG